MSVLVTLLFGATAIVASAFGIMELRMLARFLRHRQAILASGRAPGGVRTDAAPDEAPTVTIQIPLYNERTSAARVVRAAAAQEYPRDRFDIQILDDSTDETSAIVDALVEETLASGVPIQHLRRSERRGYKAGALAAGLERSTSDFVAVFDADFVPQPGFLAAVLRQARPFDDPRVAFAQARWTWGTDAGGGWLRRVLSLLLDRHFRIQKPVRAYVGNVTTFNGSGGIWRRAAIDAAGGWASDTVTEDLDLSYRCALAGWHGRYLAEIGVPNQLPGHMRAFKLQQRRWAKGTTQCLRKLTARVMGSGGAVSDRWEEAFLLAGYAIHPLLLSCLILWPWAVLYVERRLFWILQALMALSVTAAIASLLIAAHERDGKWSVRAFLETAGGIGVGVGLLVNNTVGQIQGLLESGGEFLRTPKEVGTAADAAFAGVGADRAYESPLHWTLLLEIVVIGYCVFGGVLLIQSREGMWALAMAFWAACLALVVQQQLTPRTA